MGHPTVVRLPPRFGGDRGPTDEAHDTDVEEAAVLLVIVFQETCAKQTEFETFFQTHLRFRLLYNHESRCSI